ncbi:hypothetical protein [Maribacter sp. IgM3_T14_3]|uniref:hypothetical protein n=1 Tax=Maribacter sp. IgM3_T14_3 TaxID=3415140 RepID=UPI003C6FF15B
MKFNHLLITVIIFSIILSCSSDDSENLETNPIIITSIDSSKELAFTEEEIIVSIDAEGYLNIEVTSNTNNVTVNKINSTTYTLSATVATEVTIQITLTSENFTEVKNVDYIFFEHGVIDFKVVEGLTLDKDSPVRVRELHGDPDYILTIEDKNEEVWHYFNKGFWILMDNNVDQAHYMRLYGIPWSRTFENTEYIGEQYQYEISEGLKIENLQLSMTTVVDRFGLPTEKFTSTNNERLHIYDYENLEILFYFQSDDIDDYIGKNVGYVNVY